MKFKIYHIALFLGLLFTVSASAQVDRSIGRQQYQRPPAKKEKKDFVQLTVEYYKKELKLDDFQVAAVREIIESEKDRLTALMEDKSATMEERKDRAKAIYDRIDEKTLPLLDDKQKQRYKEIRKIKDEEAEAQVSE